MNESFGLLFATPSYLEGFARVLDLGDTFTEYNTSPDAAEADFLALRSDWRAIAKISTPPLPSTKPINKRDKLLCQHLTN